MAHDYDDRIWAENRQLVSNGLDRAFRQVMLVARHLVRQQYDAPWCRIRSQQR
jgi:hypothetical protein